MVSFDFSLFLNQACPAYVELTTSGTCKAVSFVPDIDGDTTEDTPIDVLRWFVYIKSGEEEVFKRFLVSDNVKLLLNTIQEGLCLADNGGEPCLMLTAKAQKCSDALEELFKSSGF